MEDGSNHEIHRDKPPQEEGKFYVKTVDGSRIESTQEEFEDQQAKESQRQHEAHQRYKEINTAQQQLRDV